MMFNIQYLLDGRRADMQKSRAETQLTLGKLIDRLAALSPEICVCLGTPNSYRGYYDDLSFEPTTQAIPAREALALCKGAMGEVFQGYKGGDYQMGRNTPIWIADYGSCGDKLLAVMDDGTLELGKDDA